MRKVNRCRAEENPQSSDDYDDDGLDDGLETSALTGHYSDRRYRWGCFFRPGGGSRQFATQFKEDSLLPRIRPPVDVFPAPHALHFVLVMAKLFLNDLASV